MVGRRRRRLLFALILMPLVLTVVVLAGAAALTCRPAWYQPISINYAQLQDDKREQLQLENEVSAALNSGRSIGFDLDEAQVNRWIAARNELWPGRVPSIEPFRRPQVVFLDGNRARVGALVEHSGVEVVLSVTLHFVLDADRLVVTWESVQAGALPTPRKLIQETAHKVGRRLRLDDECITENSITLPIEGKWPNGDRRFRIVDLSIQKGLVHVGLDPL